MPPAEAATGRLRRKKSHQDREVEAEEENKSKTTMITAIKKGKTDLIRRIL